MPIEEVPVLCITASILPKKREVMIKYRVLQKSCKTIGLFRLGFEDFLKGNSNK